MTKIDYTIQETEYMNTTLLRISGQLLKEDIFGASSDVDLDEISDPLGSGSDVENHQDDDPMLIDGANDGIRGDHHLLVESEGLDYDEIVPSSPAGSPNGESDGYIPSPRSRRVRNFTLRSQRASAKAPSTTVSLTRKDESAPAPQHVSQPCDPPAVQKIRVLDWLTRSGYHRLKDTGAVLPDLGLEKHPTNAANSLRSIRASRLGPGTLMVQKGPTIRRGLTLARTEITVKYVENHRSDIIASIQADEVSEAMHRKEQAIASGNKAAEEAAEKAAACTEKQAFDKFIKNLRKPKKYGGLGPIGGMQGVLAEAGSPINLSVHILAGSETNTSLSSYDTNHSLEHAANHRIFLERNRQHYEVLIETSDCLSDDQIIAVTRADLLAFQPNRFAHADDDVMDSDDAREGGYGWGGGYGGESAVEKERQCGKPRESDHNDKENQSEGKDKTPPRQTRSSEARQAAAAYLTPLRTPGGFEGVIESADEATDAEEKEADAASAHERELHAAKKCLGDRGKQLTSKFCQTLPQHFDEVHAELGPERRKLLLKLCQPYVCPSCAKAYASREMLRRHMVAHRPELNASEMTATIIKALVADGWIAGPKSRKGRICRCGGWVTHASKRSAFCLWNRKNARFEETIKEWFREDIEKAKETVENAEETKASKKLKRNEDHAPAPTKLFNIKTKLRNMVRPGFETFIPFLQDTVRRCNLFTLERVELLEVFVAWLWQQGKPVEWIFEGGNGGVLMIEFKRWISGSVKARGPNYSHSASTAKQARLVKPDKDAGGKETMKAFWEHWKPQRTQWTAPHTDSTLLAGQCEEEVAYLASVRRHVIIPLRGRIRRFVLARLHDCLMESDHFDAKLIDGCLCRCTFL
ncbi:hypothetical protein HK097_006925 [Rhizophlyctis rosea]|uniref:C2H2-type domain-containing protein n=1 Tax=Rhizophlyctis rosea TaxID=64517 RepID=A0AAD5SLN6_9FUNG|nr:hypothetical protein HK097_006925 [Rhizophlyctis rosea]